MTEKTKYDLFGISQESYEKSKDVLPTLDIGNDEKFPVGSNFYMVVQSEKPFPIKHKSKFAKGKDKEKEIETNAVKVLVTKIQRMTDDGLIYIDINEKNTLWLSSKSLSMGLLRIFDETGGNLESAKIKIHKGTTEYKEFGENTCYIVTLMN